MPIHRIGMIWAQSNGQGSSPSPGGPEGGRDFAATTLAPNAAVRFAASDNFGENTSVDVLEMVPWANTIDSSLHAPHFGPEQKIGARAVTAGWTSGGNTFTILKWTHNGTPIAHFCPGGVAGNAAGVDGVDYYRLRRVIAIGCPAATDFRWYHYCMQGESDCDVADGSLAQANALGANQRALYDVICGVMGKVATNGFLVGQINVNAWGASQPTTAPWVPNGRASQAAASGVILINNNSRPLASDFLHYTGAGEHAQGDDVFDQWLATDHG